MTTNAQFKVAKEIPERTSWLYQAVLRDLNGQPIPIDAIQTLTLTLYDQATSAIINGVDTVNILNAGRGVVGQSDGSLRVHFVPGDAVIVASAGVIPVGAAETHIALLRCTYNAGIDAWVREVVHKVTNLNRVT